MKNFLLLFFTTTLFSQHYNFTKQYRDAINNMQLLTINQTNTNADLYSLIGAREVLSSKTNLQIDFNSTVKYPTFGAVTAYVTPLLALKQPLITGGTLNYLPKFNSTNGFLNSQIFDNGTNVGIGTTTPSAKLEIAGQIKITGGTPALNKVLTSDANGLASWQPIVVPTFDATVDFSVNATPNTAGTTFNPNTPNSTTVLYVSTINGSQWTYNGTSYVSAPPSASWNTGGNASTNPVTNFIGTTDNIGINFRTNNTFRQTITNNGSFGFGTSTPLAKVQFLLNQGTNNGGAGFSNEHVVFGLNNNLGGLAIGFNSFNESYFTSISPGVLWRGMNFNADNFRFRVYGGADNLTILNTGKVGVGVSVPTSNLHVNGSTAHSIRVTTANLVTIADNDYTVVCGGTLASTVTLPAANTCNGRIYIIIDQSIFNGVITAYRQFNNSTSTVLNANSSSTFQSNGIDWYRIK